MPKNPRVLERPPSLTLRVSKVSAIGLTPPRSPENQFVPRPGVSEINELVASIDSAREFLGWQPKISLEDGLQQTLDWWRTL